MATAIEDVNMPTARDKTALPNWLFPVLCTVLFVLLGFVYTTVDRRIEDRKSDFEKLERRVETQETWMKNTREQLIAHGWSVDGQGVLLPPPTSPRPAVAPRR